MMLDISYNRLTQSWDKIRTALMQMRQQEGHWEGELSQSALSTATAVIALSVVAGKPNLLPPLNISTETIHIHIKRGLEWLIQWQNSDGGWGDTIRSQSNISTTLLAWAAFNAARWENCAASTCIEKAEAWIIQRAGGLTPEHIIQVLLKKYGKDRTFSVPILSACALSGRLGPVEKAWQNILQLPFELALFPPSWYAVLRLPVVSYALPALIAIGESRHVHAPTRNPILRWIRNQSMRPAQRILHKIQPTSGGYLEAIPLTSFVVMNMASFLEESNPVVTGGLKFILQSVHEEGSWAIDSNLSTWLTTHSIRALDPAGSRENVLSPEERRYLVQWLLDQQYQDVHPYTNSAAGGWAWTHLPGGVPDADDTSGALLALHALDRENPTVQKAAKKGVAWLMQLQNSDGGVPTFCRGWGTLPFDRSCSDITAHALNAVTSWYGLDSRGTKQIDRFCDKAIRFLRKEQNSSGAWKPLWFGNEAEPANNNWTYGTSVVVSSLLDSGLADRGEVRQMVQRGVTWLRDSQHEDGGWGGGMQSASSIEETALAVKALSLYYKEKAEQESNALSHALQQGVQWLIEAIHRNDHFDATPIGFYFAELWYYEKLYPYIFAGGALNNILKLWNKR